MAVVDYDSKIKKNLVLMWIFASFFVVSIILAILFLVIDAIGNDLVSIILFVLAFLSSVLGIIFDKFRRENIKYKALATSVTHNKEELEKREKFKAETQAQLNNKRRTDFVLHRLRK
ncbi:MAG TPA: hypothetical protein VMX55_08855 [candidate division Zixibacteria bacterium]|nr:hypothetical protein [candidate division Zixibacteria bacterium]